MTGHSVERRHVPASAVPDMEADGWRTVYATGPNLRGADVLMERESVTVPIGRFLPCSVEDCARIEAYARALGVTVEAAVSILASRLADVDVYARAVGP